MKPGRALEKDVGPARAGMIPAREEREQADQRWPRTSGDDPHFDCHFNVTNVLAPHERG